MPASRKRAVAKYLELDPRKLKRAQSVLGARSEAETIDRALDEVLSEYQRNRLAAEANERFLRSGARIKDVFHRLPQ